MGQEAKLYRERFVSSRHDLKLYCRDYGDPLSRRTPLLCLAGVARNSKDFDLLARRLSQKRRVVAFDYRGRGLSDYDTKAARYQVETHIDDVLQIAAALGLHDIALLGTSFGGLLSMGLAVAQPSLVKGIILNDIGPEIEPGAAQSLMELITAAKPVADWGAAVARMKKVLPDLNLENEERWLMLAEATFKLGEDGLLLPDWDPRAISGLMKTQQGPLDLWHYYRALTQLPVLAIRGGLSSILSVATFERMKSEKPDLMQASVPNRGHAPILDELPCEDAIDEFFERLDRR